LYDKFEQIHKLAEPFLDTRDNEIHTWIAFCFARRLLKSEGGNEAVVLPAVILHDVGWKSLPEELHLKAFGPGKNDMNINRVHEVEGAKTARRILEEAQYDPALIEEIVAIILEHDSRAEAVSLNEAIVKDSDKLWRFSREALEIDPKRFNIPPAVHTQWLKLQIEGWFITETAKRIATEQQRLRAISFGIQQD
jgi:HD superfamily phosphodiesterase